MAAIATTVLAAATAMLPAATAMLAAAATAMLAAAATAMLAAAATAVLPAGCSGCASYRNPASECEIGPAGSRELMHEDLHGCVGPTAFLAQAVGTALPALPRATPCTSKRGWQSVGALQSTVRP
jgi:hypothetical protein